MNNKEEIRSYIDSWNKNETYSENRKAVELAFNEFYDTDNEVCTLNKVAMLKRVGVLDSRYNTHLPSLQKIVESILSVEKLNQRLAQGDPTVVNELVEKGVPAVFASKYCHFSNPEKYPINDSSVREVFAKYFNIPVSRLEKMFKADYQNVLDYFEKFKEEVYSDSYEELDKYLWVKGNEIKKEKKEK